MVGSRPPIDRVPDIATTALEGPDCHLQAYDQEDGKRIDTTLPRD